MLAPPNTVVRPPSLLKRVMDAVVRPPSVSPYKEQGVSGTAVHSGYIPTRERSSKWAGRERYVTIMDMATNTSIIAAGMHYFLNLIAHPQWNVAPADESDPAKKAAELIEETLHNMDAPWARVVRRAGTYRFQGFGIQEWTAKKALDGSVGLLSVEPRPQHTIEQWVVADDGSVEGVWQRHPKTGVLLGLPRKKFLYLVEDTLTDSPEGVGLFRHLAEPWERLKIYYELEARAFERDLRGIPVGRVPYSQLKQAVSDGLMTKGDAEMAMKAMEDFVQLQVKQSDTSITLDSLPYFSSAADGAKVTGTPQWGLELLQGSSSGVEALDKAIIRTQTEMARILTVEHLMMGESSGNRSLGEDKSKNLYLVANAVLEDIAMGVTNDIVPHICMLNGIPEELFPYCEPEDVAFKDAESVAATLQKMALAGAVLAPDDPVISDVRALMGVSEPAPIPPELVGLAPSPDAQLAAESADARAAEAAAQQEAQGEADAAAGTDDGEEVEKGFDPSQPRDREGQWASSGGSGASHEALQERLGKPVAREGHTYAYRREGGKETDSVNNQAKKATDAVLYRGTKKTKEFGAIRSVVARESDTVAGLNYGTSAREVVYFDLTVAGKNSTQRFKTLRAAMVRAEFERKLSLEKFDPDQPRDREGQWSQGGWDGGGDTVTAYHGASSTVAKKILKHGIKTGRSDQLAWVARDRSSAEMFGAIAAKKGEPAVLFEVKIPRDRLKDFRVVHGRTASLSETIPAEWISGYALFESSGKAGKFTSVKKADAETVYVVVVGPKEDVEKFDPSQPRAHDGKWTSGGGGLGIATGAGVSSNGAAAALLAKNSDPNATIESIVAELTPQQREMMGAARAATAAGTSTRDQFRQADGTYTPEREALHEEILGKMFTPEAVAAATPAPGERPEFVMTGGRPAAGKTSSLRSADIEAGPPKYVYLSADTIQESLPGYSGPRAGLYNPEAQDIADKAEGMARSLGVNLTFDATMKTGISATDRVDRFQKAGYDVSAYFVHTTPEMSARRSVERFATTGRFVPPEVSFNSRTNEKTFDDLTPKFKRWALFDNNGRRPRLVARSWK